MDARLSFASAALVPLLFVSSGCRTDLPACDEGMARRVAFDESPRSETPVAFEGQALMIQSCGGNGFCHSPDIPSGSRAGAPAGLDFAVQPAIVEEVDDRGVLQESEIDGGAERLQANQRRVHKRRHQIAHQVVEGLMPPDNVVAAGAGWVRGRTARAEPLPDFDSGAKDILKNWLACDSPVVEIAMEPVDGQVPGDYCGPGPNRIGDCIVRKPNVSIPTPDPTWTSIYTEIIDPFCTACHAAGLDLAADSQLSLGKMEVAYAQLVGREAMGSDCSGMGTLVEPGRPEESLLIDKLEPDPDCGQVMPRESRVMPERVVDAIRDWIAAGAAETP